MKEMLLNDYILILINLEKEYGKKEDISKLKLVSSSDDEGNGYSEVIGLPTIFLKYKEDTYFENMMMVEDKDIKNIDNLLKENQEVVVVFNNSYKSYADKRTITIRPFIKELIKISNELEGKKIEPLLVYSSDYEGNNYSKLEYLPSFGYFNKEQGTFQELAYSKSEYVLCIN